MQPSGLVVLLCILYNQTMEPTQDATKENIFNDDIQTIISLMDTKPSDDAHELISRAYTFAKDAHKEQKRASGEPYFNHLVATAQNLARYGMDPVTIAAGLLHDVIEDTPVTEEQLKEKFGDDRRTEITYAEGEITMEDLIADENVVVTISHNGYIKRTKVDEFRIQSRGGRGSRGSKTRDEDFI